MKHTSKSKKQCIGNFCPRENPDCEHCKIDEALDILEDFIRARESSPKELSKSIKR